MNIKDYLHLYIGLDVCREHVESRSKKFYEYGKLVGVSESEVERGKCVAIIDVGIDHFHEWYVEETKPVLRPLSEMTEKEAEILCAMQIKGLRDCDRVKIVQMMPTVKFVIYTDSEDPLDERRIRRFLNIESYLVPQFKFLIDKQFDLFGLIEAGLAISAPDLLATKPETKD